MRTDYAEQQRWSVGHCSQQNVLKIAALISQQVPKLNCLSKVKSWQITCIAAEAELFLSSRGIARV